MLSFKCIVVIDIFHEKNINDKNTFWKAIQPFLSDKVRSTSKMTLIDKENNIVDEYNTAKVMSTFFSYIVNNLNIAECSNCEPVANNISDPLLKCVVTYRNHPSILAIGLPFSFSKINREEILWKSLKLQTSEACQDTYIPTKIIKENVDIFSEILLASFNDSVEKSNFHPS